MGPISDIVKCKTLWQFRAFFVLVDIAWFNFYFYFDCNECRIARIALTRWSFYLK